MSDKGWEGFGSTVGSIIGERLASPLISTFAVSWSLWNFKFFVILFSKNSVTATYALIQAECFPTPFMSFFNGLAAPLTLTMAYFYLLPVFSKIIFEEWSRTQKETKDIKQRWEDQELLGSAEALVLRRKLRAAEVKVEDLEFDVNKLKAEGRQIAEKLTEEKDNHRITAANHKSVSEDLSRTHSTMDDLRNKNAELSAQLVVAGDRSEALIAELDAWRRAQLTLGQPLHTRAAGLLKAIAHETTASYTAQLPRFERQKVTEDLPMLRALGYTRLPEGQQKFDTITSIGLQHLFQHGDLTESEYKDLLAKLGFQFPPGARPRL